jgi:Protein of unknown function (DUF2442)
MTPHYRLSKLPSAWLCADQLRHSMAPDRGQAASAAIKSDNAASCRRLLRGQGSIMNDIVEVAHLGGHRLFLRVTYGVAGEVDLGSLLQFTGISEPLRNPLFFALVRVDQEIGTMLWPNAADLCPDVLHHHLTASRCPGRPTVPTAPDKSCRAALLDWTPKGLRPAGGRPTLSALGKGRDHAAGFSCTSIAIA